MIIRPESIMFVEIITVLHPTRETGSNWFPHHRSQFLSSNPIHVQSRFYQSSIHSTTISQKACTEVKVWNPLHSQSIKTDSIIIKNDFLTLSLILIFLENKLIYSSNSDKLYNLGWSQQGIQNVFVAQFARLSLNSPPLCPFLCNFEEIIFSNTSVALKKRISLFLSVGRNPLNIKESVFALS